MDIVRSTAPGLIVSTSGIGNGLFHEKLCEAADFILIHGNGCAPDIYEEWVLPIPWQPTIAARRDFFDAVIAQLLEVF